MAETMYKPINILEAAAFTGYSKNYLYNMIQRGKIPHYKPNNGRVFFKREDLEKFLFGRGVATYQSLAEKAERILNAEA
jgi:excisionase family DNA binding protein